MNDNEPYDYLYYSSAIMFQMKKMSRIVTQEIIDLIVTMV